MIDRAGHISAINKITHLLYNFARFHHREHRNTENFIEKSEKEGTSNSIDDNRQEGDITTWYKTVSFSNIRQTRLG